MKQIKTIIILFIIFLTQLFWFSFVFTAYAGESYGGLENTAATAGVDKYGDDVKSIIGGALGRTMYLIAILFFGLVLYAGIRWMLARGNEDEAKKARDMIIAAVVGLVIVLGSYAITTLVYKGITTGQVEGNEDNSRIDNNAKQIVELGCCRCQIQNKGIVYGIVNSEPECLETKKEEYQDVDQGIQEIDCEYKKVEDSQKDQCSPAGWGRL